jgi:ribosomal protein S18 acetylase RimI-like enzyme
VLGLEYRGATAGDLEAVERLLLATFGAGPWAALRGIPPDLALGVRLALRRAAPDPTGGLLVACDGPALAGVIAFETAETADPPGLAALRHLRPLGLPAALRVLARLRATAYRPAPDEAYFWGLAIEPPYRRRGLGAGLIAAAEGAARRRDKRVARCLIAGDNAASLALARKRGFRETPAPASPAALLRRLIPGRRRVVRLEKALAPSAGAILEAVWEPCRPMSA